jgi:hypothetical protein
MKNQSRPDPTQQLRHNDTEKGGPGTAVAMLPEGVDECGICRCIFRGGTCGGIRAPSHQAAWADFAVECSSMRRKKGLEPPTVSDSGFDLSHSVRSL